MDGHLLERLAVFLVVTAVAGLAALVGFFALLVAGVGHEDLFFVLLFDGTFPLAAALVSGTLVGLAAATGAREMRVLRAFAVLALLTAGVVLAMVTWTTPVERSFSAEAFRGAAASDDTDRLELEAHRAIESEVLVGMTRAQVRALLGEPQRTGPHRRLWIWDVGMINDFMGPGDGGAFYVRFDEDWGEVKVAAVAQSAPELP